MATQKEWVGLAVLGWYPTIYSVASSLRSQASPAWMVYGSREVRRLGGRA